MYVLTIETERGAAAKVLGRTAEAKVCARGFVNKVGKACRPSLPSVRDYWSLPIAPFGMSKKSIWPS